MWRAAPYTSTGYTSPGALTRRPARSTAIVLAAVALLAFAYAASLATTALAATPPPSESLVIFEGQLNGHQVSSVTLHTKAHTFHASLTDGRRVIIAFPSSQQQQLVNDVRAKGITVKVAKVQPASHKRRYIVGGVVIVVIILAVVGVLLLTRRRRMREEEEGPGAPAGYSTGR